MLATTYCIGFITGFLVLGAGAACIWFLVDALKDQNKRHAKEDLYHKLEFEDWETGRHEWVTESRSTHREEEEDNPNEFALSECADHVEFTDENTYGYWYCKDSDSFVVLDWMNSCVMLIDRESGTTRVFGKRND